MSFRILSRSEEEYFEELEKRAAIKINVVGIGGCGNNIIDTLSKQNLPAKLIAMNTDAAVLRRIKAHKKVLLGNPLNPPRGAHGSPEIGKKAMEESIEDALNAIDENVDVVIGIAGLGGGTGTGGLPILFRELTYSRPNALKLAIVTLPFREEGIERIENARYGLREVFEVSDAVIVNANDLLTKRVKVTSITEAFKIMNRRIVRIVESLINLNNPEIGPGIINVDFSNIKKILTKSGLCFAGIGTEFSIQKAFQIALRDDMSDSNIMNAKGALILFEGRESDLNIEEAKNVVKLLSSNFNIREVFMGLRPLLNINNVKVSLFIASVKSEYIEKFLEGEERW